MGATADAEAKKVNKIANSRSLGKEFLYVAQLSRTQQDSLSR